MDAHSYLLRLLKYSDQLCKLATDLRETLGRVERSLNEPQPATETLTGTLFPELVTLDEQLFDTADIFHRQLCRSCVPLR